MVDRTEFYEKINPLFGSFKQSQVDGCNIILDYHDKNGYYDGRQLAYILATVFHETARTMQPIAEYGKGKNRRYGKTDPVTGFSYYGRGYVQLTWDYNYKKMSDIVGVDLYKNPDLAMQPDIAIQILFYGMAHGTFTGKKLDDYFNDEKSDAFNARKIINGLDKAVLIEGYYNTFLSAIFSK